MRVCLDTSATRVPICVGARVKCTPNTTFSLRLFLFFFYLLGFLLLLSAQKRREKRSGLLQRIFDSASRIHLQRLKLYKQISTDTHTCTLNLSFLHRNKENARVIFAIYIYIYLSIDVHVQPDREVSEKSSECLKRIVFVARMNACGDRTREGQLKYSNNQSGLFGLHFSPLFTVEHV